MTAQARAECKTKTPSDTIGIETRSTETPCNACNKWTLDKGISRIQCTCSAPEVSHVAGLGVWSILALIAFFQLLSLNLRGAAILLVPLLCH